MAASLPYDPAFDLCGAEPNTLRRRYAEAAPAARREDRSDQSAKLTKIVEAEIIPRLMVLHARPEAATSPDVGPELIEKFAYYSISEPPTSLLAIVGGLLQRGVSLDSVYLDVLGPAARRLGEMWSDDTLSYADVTIALGRLQHVVRELSVHGDPSFAASRGDRAALFAPAPGEQHTFGIVIVEEFFRRAGWRTWSELSGQRQEVEAAVAAHHFDLFGVTASSREKLDLIAPLIKSVRRTSRNRDITVLVGGLLFLEEPELAATVGADGMAPDARDALLMAEGAVRQLTRR